MVMNKVKESFDMSKMPITNTITEISSAKELESKIELLVSWSKSNMPGKSKYKPDKEALRSMNTVLSSAMREEKEIPLTPYGKNAWYSMQPNSNNSLTLHSDFKQLTQVMMEDLFKYGQEAYWHDHKQALDYNSVSEEHYACVDFWRNFWKMGPEVTPGAPESRLETLDKYNQLHETSMDWSTMLHAVKWVHNQMPSKFRTQKHTSLSDYQKMPFTKGTANVGHPLYAKSTTVIDGSSPVNMTNQTATADFVSLQISKQLKLEEMNDQPAMLIGRNQSKGWDVDNANMLKSNESGITMSLLDSMPYLDSKASVVYAYDRIENYVFAQFMVPAMNDAKSYASWIGYHTKEDLMDFLIKWEKSIVKHDLKSANMDFSSFDTTVSPQLLMLAGTIAEAKIEDSYGKELLWESINAALHKPIIYKDLKKMDRILFKYGAIPSGWMGTNYFGGLVSKLSVTYAKMVVYGVSKHKKLGDLLVNDCGTDGTNMGDDYQTWLQSYKDLMPLAEVLKSHLGLVINALKGELGTFFLQHSVVNGKWYYPAPSVFSKIFFVETPKSLYNAHWTMATFMKLGQLNDEDFNAVAKMVMKYDADKLGLIDYVTGEPGGPDTFSKSLKEEANSTGVKTKDALFDGNPQVEFMLQSEDFMPTMFKRISALNALG
uniref:RdRp n=1 Tax=Beihai picobirna-like virus 3 TaxID=1922520 RepID=A0A1L3KLG1_9VIRU|nr:RdRp [Beihai picobirna-like virus 3]